MFDLDSFLEKNQGKPFLLKWVNIQNLNKYEFNVYKMFRSTIPLRYLPLQHNFIVDEKRLSSYEIATMRVVCLMDICDFLGDDAISDSIIKKPVTVSRNLITALIDEGKVKLIVCNK